MRRIITILLVTAYGFAVVNGGLDDIDFDIEDAPQKPGAVFNGVAPGSKQHSMQESLLKAMQKPAVREQIGQVIPILRSMSPQQRLTLAALVSSQIMTPQQADQQSLNDVAQMFSGPGQSPKNVSEQLLLPISMDIAKMFKGIASDAGRSWKFSELPGKPTSPRPSFPFSYSSSDSFRRPNLTKKSFPLQGSAKNEVNRRNGIDDTDIEAPNAQNCDFLTSDICQEVSHYPEAEILGSIQKHLSMMEPFLTEFGDIHTEEQDSPRMQRRQDIGENLVGAEDGHMCPSQVKYAKPKRSRTTSGAWKYIVNTGEYTQTLRLEICTTSGAACSFLNNEFRSSCQQVYNYHRLMCWDEKRGLHMDVFKVPSCCSCHIQGYSTKFPPDFPFAEKRQEVVPQSSSGVKREIPRPHQYRERPERPFFELQPEGNAPHNPSMDFPDDGLSETQNYQQRVPARPFVFKEPGPPPHQTFSNNAIPNQFNSRPGQFPVEHEGQRFQDGYASVGRPHVGQGFHNNVDNQRPSGEIVSHLVPPGPPLPLDYDRPRPSFDNRRKNESLNRGPEYTIEPSHNNKRGTQKYEQTLPKPQVPQRTRRPTVKPVVDPAASPAENNRVQVKHPSSDGGFGSKIRGQKPQKTTVFVTPSPHPPPPDRDEFVKPVRVTPRPPNKPLSGKPPPKKVNYNYHPIIDFFSPVGQAPFAGHVHNKAPVQFNRRQESDVEADAFTVPTKNHATYERYQPQYSQPYNEEEPIADPEKYGPVGRPQKPYTEINRQHYDGGNRREDESDSDYQHSQSNVPHIQQHQPGAHEWTPI